MVFLYIKAVHIIFIVTWFAALFYMPRLFVYYAEANLMSEPEKSILQKQYLLMQTRLWNGIAWPSMIITIILGFSLVYIYGTIPTWLIWKLLFVSLLIIYHLSCHYIHIQQKKGESKYTSMQMRIWNEVATIFLVAIVFLVVLKNSLQMFYGLAGLVLFIVMLLLGIKIYKSFRTTL
ncbi:MAG: CopD family protein [Bacteroidota bacterium]|nr:CopD family protein [Bacteroidota bacterium]